MIVQVDRSGLYNHPMVLPKKGEGDDAAGSGSQLVRDLRVLISMRGPVSVADFMRQAMSHPTHGYYMRKDVFGRHGDFTTAPEISQMFGELVGVWVVATWEQLGKPERFTLLEAGPGRGTLMKDLLRTLRQFPQVYKAVSICMVEISPALRAIQQETLGVVVDGPERAASDGDASDAADGAAGGGDTDASFDGSLAELVGTIPDGPRVEWHTTLLGVPADESRPLIAVAQELFDALPIHQFEKTDRGWRERLIDVADHGEGGAGAGASAGAGAGADAGADAGAGADAAAPDAADAGAAAGATASAQAQSQGGELPEARGVPPSLADGDLPPAADFRMVLAPGITPALSAVLMAVKRGLAGDVKKSGVADGAGEGEREPLTYRSKERNFGSPTPVAEEEDEWSDGLDSELDSDSDAEAAVGGGADKRRVAAERVLEHAPLGTTLEFSPAANAFAYELAEKIGVGGGAALVIDYGAEHGFRDTLRGIREHKFVSPLSDPGLVDLSADVVFGAIRAAANASQHTRAFGPVTQSMFLQTVGLEPRLAQLVASAGSAEDKDRLISEARRLIHPEEMGEVYKVLSMVSVPPAGRDNDPEETIQRGGTRFVPIGGFTEA